MLTQKASVRRKYREFKTVQLKLKYNALAKECRRLIHEHVRIREEKIINSQNIGQFYKYVNKKLASRYGIGPLKDNNGQFITQDDKKSDMLNKYFKSMFIIDDGIVHQVTPKVEECDTLSSVTFEPNSVLKVLKKLNPNSASGPDGIKPLFLKNTADALYRPPAFLFECLFLNGFVPNDWRLAYITPIFKKGGRMHCFKLQANQPNFCLL